MTEDLTRRRLFGLAGAAAAGAAGLGAGGCSLVSGGQSQTLTTAASTGPGFVSRPDLTPPQIKVNKYALGTYSKYIFLNAPYSGPGQGGTMILDMHGRLVWMGPNTATHHRMNFSVQSYQGEPMLTWWQGIIVEGYGKGYAVLADSSYHVRHTVHMVGIEADFHELNITPAGTALMTAYKTYSGVDLTAVGGSSNGYLLSGVAQEIDIATGNLLHEWDSWTNQQVGLTESYQQIGVGDGGYGTAASPYNYFHINSISPYDDQHWLISARNTWCVYLVNKFTGQIVWRLNGKRSSFTMSDPRTKFYWQHHVRLHPSGVLTVFDNGSSPAEEAHSRALELHLDTTTRTATLKKQFYHPGATILSGAMGSAQLLPSGHMFVGWGTTPAFSEFAADGTLLLDGQMEIGSPSYRGFTADWIGKPAGKPAVAARHASGGATVYASWNGSTKVASWTVLAGSASTSLSSIGSARKTGFETAINVSNSGPYFAVQARDAGGNLLATSPVAKIA